MEMQLENLGKVPAAQGPDLVVITGMSGAGRTEAMHAFEDLGYFCIDNLPPSLLINLVALAGTGDGGHRKLAVVCDLRSREFFPELLDELKRIDQMGLTHSVLFLDTEDAELLTRYKTTRRRHPLCDDGMTISAGIQRERALLNEAREVANYVINTTNLSAQDLRKRIRSLYTVTSEQDDLNVSVFSFGYKHGAPLDADIVIDVRFLPNPYYEADLRTLTGLDAAVARFILDKPETEEFLACWHQLLDVVMPGYIKEGKRYLSIGVGCTGGQHRSVCLAQTTYGYLKDKGYRATITHRDIALAEVN
jgi:RNase adapter protein RapZ